MIWFAILSITIFFLRKLKLTKQRYVFAVILVVFTAAFIYAQVQVNYDQGAAYFNTFARVWEFALGGIVGIIATKMKLNSLVQ